jgi:hypothetical protein
VVHRGVEADDDEDGVEVRGEDLLLLAAEAGGLAGEDGAAGEDAWSLQRRSPA